MKAFMPIALISLLIFIYVQYILVYNTYELKKKQYNIKEKSIINDAYSSSLSNDKVFPGGQKLIDSFINRNMMSLESLYLSNPTIFEIRKQLICDSIFRQLRKESSMDSLFSQIVKRNQLNKSLQYLLTVAELSVTFDGIHYVPLYTKKGTYPLIEKLIQSSNGIIIGGRLKEPDTQNLTSAYTVSHSSAHSYRLGFNLYADKNNRTMAILKEMAPTFLLSVSSIVFVIAIFYFTYSNWLKQKKLADMKSDFLNSITHEFNTPISTILVANKSLFNKEIIASQENIFSLAEVINRQSLRLKALVSQALNVAAMPTKGMEKESCSVNSFMEEIIHDYRFKAASAVVIRFIPQFEEMIIQANQFLFTTLLYNIFDNAIKYNLSVHKEISIKAYAEDQNLIIAIQDNGIGMTKKTIDHIYEKFYRGDNTIKSSGLGLGLFYVKQSIESQGWNLKLNSKEGMGSEFCISIPIEAKESYEA